MAKLDLRKQYKDLFTAGSEPHLLTVPPLLYLCLDGRGDPTRSPDFGAAMQALYALAYGLKFTAKKQQPSLDFAVMTLESLWWAEDMDAFSLEERDQWLWRAIILQPEFITPELLDTVRTEVLKKKPEITGALNQAYLDTLEEGLCAQIMHIGPYSTEKPTLDTLHAFIEAQGLRMIGKHHEIYLSDPSRSTPDRLRTIIRQPVEARQP
jgi:hypothetical protein